MSTFGIGIEWEGDVVRLRVKGELDLAVASQLVERVEAVRDSSAKLALIDLSDVTFMDSSGLRSLLAAQRVADAADGFETIAVCAPKPVRDVLEITGAAPMLRLADSPDAALGLRAG